MADPPSRTREVPRRASLATRSAALYSVLVAGAVLLAGWLTYSGNRQEVLEGRERDLEHRVRTVQVRIGTEVQAVANDVLFLAKAPFLRRLADSWLEGERHPELVTDAQDTFAALLKGKPSYAQTRLLNLAGQGNEIIRLDHRGGRVLASPPDALQAKGHRDYFRESARLEPDEVYLSQINLNREFGEVSIPHTPTLRAAAKVFDSAGQAFGLVVINIDLRPLFEELRATAGAEASLYLANAEGDFLVHPLPSRSFGFDLGKRFRLTGEFGVEPVRSPTSRTELARFVEFPLREGSGRTLIAGVAVPRERVLSELTTIRNRSLAAALGAAVLAAALVWILAFLLSRRLVKLADAIGGYEPGGGSPVLPERGNDEVAVVARKFSSLSARIDDQVRSLERARQLADENRQAKEEFLATLSHEIRTPMNAVTGLLHSLATNHPAKHQRPVLEALQFASRKLVAVVNDVLDFSKIEAGQITFERAPFDLHELLESVRTAHQAQAEDQGVALRFAWSDHVPRMVVGDSLRLYQILNNLVQNAIKFTERGGRVTTRIEQGPCETGGRIELSFCVEDTGVGMTPDQLEQALSRFGQVHPETARKFGGTGLGLPIARMLVELQGGTFDTSSIPEVGSKFQFRLEFDAVPDGAGDLARPVRTAPQLEGVRILCVEDVASNRQVVAALLESSRAGLDFAPDAAEALRLLRSAAEGSPLPDLILLDLQLPDRDGASLATEIRQQWPQIPVIGLTAQTAGTLLERCRSAGVTTFLWKPIDPERFFDTIEQAAQSVRDPECEPASKEPAHHLNTAPVWSLFDEDREKASHYLRTLADELDEAASAVFTLSSQRREDELRALHHRLQNGLTLVEAPSVLETIDSLSNMVREDVPRVHEAARDCHQLLARTAAELRERSGQSAPIPTA